MRRGYKRARVNSRVVKEGTQVLVASEDSIGDWGSDGTHIIGECDSGKCDVCLIQLSTRNREPGREYVGCYT